MPFLALPGVSLQRADPVALAECLASLLAVRSCAATTREAMGRSFRCLMGGLRLGSLSLMALWGPGLRGGDPRQAGQPSI